MISMNKYKKYMPAFVLVLIALFVFYIDAIPDDNGKEKYNKASSLVLTNAADYLDIPSLGYTVGGYLKESEGTHPDILYFPEGWNGYEYWMSFTPFPNGGLTINGISINDVYENPCIIVSHDGINWTEPAGISNPLVPAPTFGYNNDPDIVFVRDSLYMYFNETDTVNRVVRMKLMKSANGINWTAPQMVMSEFSYHEVSPTTIFENNTHKMWYVRIPANNAPASNIIYRTSPDGINWSDTTVVNISIPNYVIWHIDILKHGSTYRGIFASYKVGTSSGKTELFYGESSDGLTWSVNATPILKPAPGSWDAQNIYRSTFIIQGPKIRVWYAAKKQNANPREWHIGYTEGEDPALPVTLTSFTANANGSSVLLEWNTATEINNYGFQVQRSEYDRNNPEKREWQILGMVAGAGNSSSPKSYTFVDSGVKYGRYYAYRLKQFDYDGMYFNSQEAKAYTGVSVKLELSQNYPNPFNPVTKIRFSVPEETSAKFSIYNIIGQLIYSKTYDRLQSGIHEEEWNGTGFPSGIYIYSLETINSRGIYNKAINKMNLVK